MPPVVQESEMGENERVFFGEVSRINGDVQPIDACGTVDNCREVELQMIKSGY